MGQSQAEVGTERNEHRGPWRHCANTLGIDVMRFRRNDHERIVSHDKAPLTWGSQNGPFEAENGVSELNARFNENSQDLIPADTFGATWRHFLALLLGDHIS